jgi:hypothetical protein
MLYSIVFPYFQAHLQLKNMSVNNLITIPVHFPLGVTVKPRDTYHNLKIDLKTAKIDIPKDAKATTAWIAMMHGSGYAEMIWSIHDLTPDFVVNLFISNPTDRAIRLFGPAKHDGHLLITFVVLYDLPEAPKKVQKEAPKQLTEETQKDAPKEIAKKSRAKKTVA